MLERLFEGLEIEERRPRTWNEPRRKRLRFVKGGTRGPEEWQVATSTMQRRPNQHEQWHQRQVEAAGRFMHQERLREQERARYEEHVWRLRNPIPRPPLEGDRGGDPRLIPMPPPDHRRDHGHQDDIVAMISDESSESDSDQPIRMIKAKPKKEKLPWESRKRSKSRGRKDKKGRKVKKRPSSSDSESSDDDHTRLQAFMDGWKARSRTRSRTPVRGRSRSRSRSRHFFNLPDDSWESLPRFRRLSSKPRYGRR